MINDIQYIKKNVVKKSGTKIKHFNIRTARTTKIIMKKAGSSNI